MMSEAEIAGSPMVDDPLLPAQAVQAQAAGGTTGSRKQQHQVQLHILDDDGLLIRSGSPESQVEQFVKLFANGDMQTLCTKALGGALRHYCYLRSLAWKVFVGVLPSAAFPRSVRNAQGSFVMLDHGISGAAQTTTWLTHTQGYRQRFATLVQEHFIDPHRAQEEHEEQEKVFNPLAQDDPSNPWSKFFEQQELERTIQQDLIRLYPEHPFFRTPSIQHIMLRVLYVWSRENTDTSYRQGMHELLAPIVLVLHRDAKQPAEMNACAEQHAQNFDEESTEVAKMLSVLLDESQLEADAFVLFERLMAGMKEFFRVVERPASASTPSSLSGKSLFKGAEDALFGASGGQQQQQQQQQARPVDPFTTTPIYHICNRIQNVLLKRKDPQLHDFLTDMDIEPQIYGLRWVRLLYGREFHLEDVLCLWDALFADCGGFRSAKQVSATASNSAIDLSLVEHIAVMMLIYIRQQLLQMDHSQVLRRLMKYPPVEDVHIFVEKAMESRNDPDAPVTGIFLTSGRSTPDGDYMTTSKAEEQKTPVRRTQAATGQHHRSQTGSAARPSSSSNHATYKPKPLPSLFQGNPISGLFASGASGSLFGNPTGTQGTSAASSSSTQPKRSTHHASHQHHHHHHPTASQSQSSSSAQRQQQPQASRGADLARQSVDKEIKLGEAMEKLLANIQRELFEKPNQDESVVLMSLAKLKHIKDILKFQLELTADEISWINQDVQAASQPDEAAAPAPVASSQQPPSQQLHPDDSASLDPLGVSPVAVSSIVAQDSEGQEVDPLGVGGDYQLLTPPQAKRG